MDFIQEVITYKFLSNALWASLLVGVVCGIIGTYIVCRRLVFLSGGITHASFGGIGLAYFLGMNPILGAGVFAVLTALGIEWASTKGRVREDSAIGIMWSVGMALGIIFVYLTPGYAPNLMSFLFGNILTVTFGDIVALAILGAIVVLFFVLMLRLVLYVAFDREYAESQGVNTRIINYAMAIVVAMTIVLSIRVVGIVLLISLLTMPTVIATIFCKTYMKITIWASAIAVAGNIAGLYCSYKLNIPAGAATIFVLTLTLIMVKIIPLCYNRLKASA